MRIGVVGSGNIGGTAARLFEEAGHEVLVGSRSNGRVEEACAFGEMVLVAIPFAAYPTLPAEALEGRIVIDAMNYYPGRDGHFEDLDRDRTTSTELLADHVSGARVVKAFNTMQAATLGEEGRPAGDPHRLVLLVAGDDVTAKRLVGDLIDEIGFEAVDTGGLADGGRRQQPGTPLYGAEVTAAEAREALGLG
jgi:8-hydroxy-5-deazaflavin:NADPH oxidoreductase